MPWWVLFISDWVSAGARVLIVAALLAMLARRLHFIAVEHKVNGEFYTEYVLAWGSRAEVLGEVEERMEAER